MDQTTQTLSYWERSRTPQQRDSADLRSLLRFLIESEFEIVNEAQAADLDDLAQGKIAANLAEARAQMLDVADELTRRGETVELRKSECCIKQDLEMLRWHFHHMFGFRLTSQVRDGKVSAVVFVPRRAVRTSEREQDVEATVLRDLTVLARAHGMRLAACAILPEG